MNKKMLILTVILFFLITYCKTPTPKVVKVESVQPVKEYKMNKAGKKFFEKSCILCHGIIGLADGPVSNSLSKKPNPLRKGKMKHKINFKTIYDIILKGIPKTEMPSFKGDYTPTQREKIARYVLYLTQLND